MFDTMDLGLGFDYIGNFNLENINIEEYMSVFLSPEEFEVFEKASSGSRIAGTWESAICWVKERQLRLHAEFKANEEEHGEYTSYCDLCRSLVYIDEEVPQILYETSSGTILHRDNQNNFEVLIPEKRLGYRDGYYRKHHLYLVLAKAGFTNLEIDLSQGQNTGLLPKSKKPAFLKAAKELNLPLEYLEECRQTQFGNPDSVKNYLTEFTRKYYASL